MRGEGVVPAQPPLGRGAGSGANKSNMQVSGVSTGGVKRGRDSTEQGEGHGKKVLKKQ